MRTRREFLHALGVVGAAGLLPVMSCGARGSAKRAAFKPIKFGIISDIHGNYAALEAVSTELERLGVSRIICLGDVAGYYCHINECCAFLQKKNIVTLMGNHDWYIVNGGKCPRSNSANRCLEYQNSVLESGHREWLASLKPQAHIEILSLVHGGWKDPLDEYMLPSADYFRPLAGSFFASGHTHVPCVWRGAQKTYCNPGSVGQPRDGDNRASFAVFDHSGFTLHRVAYDIQRTQRAMRIAGFDPYFYDNLSGGTKIGG